MAPRDLRPDVWVSLAIPWFAALIAVCLRIWARRMTKVSWWFDDYFSILGFLFATGYSGIMVEWTLHTYMGVYLPEGLSKEEREAIFQQSRFLSYFNSLCYAASIACSKIAILCLYWRIFKLSPIRIPILVLLGIVTVWILIRTLMLTFRCVPVQSLWDHSITDKVCNINSEQFFLGTIMTHFLLDIIILLLPLIEVFRLRMHLAQKIAVAALFLLGTIVCIASGFVLAILVTPSEHVAEETYDYTMFCVWGSVEVNIAIVSACFPLLRPVFKLIFPKGVFSSYGKNSYHISGKGLPLSGNSHPADRSRNITKGISIVRSRKTNPDADDSSSTYQLADMSNGTSSDFTNKQTQDGVRTIIMSQGPDSQSGISEPGIFVSSDTVVEYDQRV
ncbi:hypothetical protein F5883DRAFT_502585 [Diaporthe sp. PMI_573]|nr:hypothetical protein F5883DRAFT_502585 [Diaporthaceae sp. PMI_573]